MINMVFQNLSGPGYTLSESYVDDFVKTIDFKNIQK